MLNQHEPPFWHLRVQRRGRPNGFPGTQNAAPGFTLIEILVSLSIIAVVLLTVYRLHSQTLSMNHDMGFYTTAPLLANAKLTDIVAAFPEPPQDDTGDFGDQYPEYSWKVSVQDVILEQLGETTHDLKQIDMTIAFNDGERSFHLRTFRLIR